MEPYYFGPAGELFGIFHPAGRSIRDRAVVIAPPLFNDYMRSHRTLRQAAVRLSGMGYSVLRFDYRGTGNSRGDLTDVTREDWVTDLGEAVNELRDIAGVDKPVVLAVRHSAALLCEALQTCSVKDAVLWDPALADESLLGRVTEDLQIRGFQGDRRFVDSWNSRPPTTHLKVESITLVLTSRQEAVINGRRMNVDFDCGWQRGRLDDLIYSRELLDTLCDALQ